MKKPPAAVLRLINKGRAALGMKPRKTLPKGESCNALGCVIHNAFWKIGENPGVRRNCIDTMEKKDAIELAKVWKTRAYTDSNGFKTVLLPNDLRKFIVAFDEGKYPQLEKA